MLPDLFRITSVGSIWEFDLLDMRYRRWPKHEAPRENPEWGSEAAGALQDYVWHQMSGPPTLHTTNSPWGDAVGYMRIPIDQLRQSFKGKARCVHAPLDLAEFQRVRILMK